jgi:hypothetical protein
MRRGEFGIHSRRADAHLGALVPVGDHDIAADGEDPFTHAGEPHTMLGITDATMTADGKPLAVIAHAQHEIVTIDRNQHVDLGGLRMAHHVRQRLLQSAEQRQIGVGVQLRFRWFARLYAGPQSLTVVEVEPKAEVRYDVVAPGVRTKTSAMGAQHGALAAINGGFFAIESTGLSTGLLRIDGALVVPAKPAQASIGIGDDQRLRVATRPEGDWSEVHDALGAGPMLLRAGAVVDHGARQRRIRHPRSAIGVGKDGSVVWLTADGRTSKAAGLAHEETAAILQALGCVDAVNLDGGGSTTLWVAGRGVVNPPCDNKKYDHAGERAVANAVLLRAPAVVVVDDAQATLRGDGWTRATVAGGKGVVGAGYARWSAKAGTSAAAGEAPSAEFAAELPFAGTWRAMAWLPVGSEVAAGPWRVVVGADGAVREVAGQRGEWVEVARVEVGTERKVVVQLGGVAGRAVVVDAVRWVEIR